MLDRVGCVDLNVLIAVYVMTSPPKSLPWLDLLDRYFIGMLFDTKSGNHAGQRYSCTGIIPATRRSPHSLQGPLLVDELLVLIAAIFLI